MIAFFLAVILVSPLATTTLLWLCGIRPWLRKIGEPVITGANWAQSAFGDWTMAREAVRKRGRGPWFVWAFPASLALWIAAPLLVLVLIGLLEAVATP